MNIVLTASFKKRYKKLPKLIQNRFKEKIRFFLSDKNHPSLKIHELHGKLRGSFSMSINQEYRTIYKKIDNQSIEFINIGTHSIYQ